MDSYNAICICETWFNEITLKSECFLYDYIMIRCDRKQVISINPLRGTLIAVKNSCEKVKMSLDS